MENNLQQRFPGDENKSESYIFRRNLLLNFMKKQRWDDPNDKTCSKKKGRKPKPIPKPMVDLNKPRNKFFRFE